MPEWKPFCHPNKGRDHQVSFASNSISSPVPLFSNLFACRRQCSYNTCIYIQQMVSPGRSGIEFIGKEQCSPWAVAPNSIWWVEQILVGPKNVYQTALKPSNVLFLTLECLVLTLLSWNFVWKKIRTCFSMVKSIVTIIGLLE